VIRDNQLKRAGRRVNLNDSCFVCFLLGNSPASEIDMPFAKWHRAYKLETPGNYPKESIQHLEHGESLKSRRVALLHLKVLILSNRFRVTIRMLT
jgi:hypothetical protein